MIFPVNLPAAPCRALEEVQCPPEERPDPRRTFSVQKLKLRKIRKRPEILQKYKTGARVSDTLDFDAKLFIREDIQLLFKRKAYQSRIIYQEVSASAYRT